MEGWKTNPKGVFIFYSAYPVGWNLIGRLKMFRTPLLDRPEMFCTPISRNLEMFRTPQFSQYAKKFNASSTLGISSRCFIPPPVWEFHQYRHSIHSNFDSADYELRKLCVSFHPFFLSSPWYMILWHGWVSFKECSFWPVSSRADYLGYTLYFYKNIFDYCYIEFLLLSFKNFVDDSWTSEIENGINGIIGCKGECKYHWPTSGAYFTEKKRGDEQYWEQDTFWRKNYEAETFLAKRNDRARNISEKKLTGRRILMEWIRTIVIKYIEKIPLQIYLSVLWNGGGGAKTFCGKKWQGINEMKMKVEMKMTGLPLFS